MTGRYTRPAVPLMRHLSVRAEVENFRAWAERIGDPDLLADVAHTAELFERAGWTLEVNAMRSLEALGRDRAAWEVKEVVDAAKAADSAKGGAAERQPAKEREQDVMDAYSAMRRHVSVRNDARRIADQLSIPFETVRGILKRTPKPLK